MKKFTVHLEKEKVDEIRKKVEHIIFTRQELGVLHNSFRWGDNIYRAIISGDTQKIQAVVESDITISGMPGKLSADASRNLKNLIICYIANLTADVIRDRYLDEETAYSISDATIQIVEAARTPKAVLSAVAACAYIINERIGQNSLDYHPMVRNAKNYIYKHLHEKLTVTNIAKKLNTSPSYLAQIFRRYEGITVHEYIRQERVERSRNLLLYSDYSLQTIANYLGYASQSHFGKEFKTVTGLTPSEFRRQTKEYERDEL